MKKDSKRRRAVLLLVLCLAPAFLQGCVLGGLIGGAGRLVGGAVVGAGRLVGGALRGVGGLLFGNVVGADEITSSVQAGLPGAPAR